MAYKRTPAERMFAAEIKGTTSKIDKVSTDQYEPQLFLSPTGAHVSRVLIVGAATEKENVGADIPLWRLRITDPTGGVFAYAGQYQPEAAQKIAQLDIPCFVAVVGKITTYQAEDGGDIITSLRVEDVCQVNDETRKLFLMDAAQQTLARMKKLISPQHAQEMAKIKEVYPKFQTKEYLYMASIALQDVVGQESATPEAQAGNPPPAKPSISETPLRLSEMVYQILKKHDTGKGTKQEVIPMKLKEQGYSLVDWEKAVKELKNNGMCYDAENGLLKAI